MLSDRGQEAGDFNPPEDKTKEDGHTGAQEKARVDDKEYLDPVYKKLSAINGEINKMNRQQLQDKLAELRLNTRGVNDVLKKRLKTYYRQKKLEKARISPPKATPYDYLLVIDFEATCEENSPGYNHEIIEFPVILVDAHEMKVVDEFHSYCRPTLTPKLTKFCTKLTGISQAKVDGAEIFPRVLEKMESWMESHHLGKGHTFAILTDGPWDMSRFLTLQCYHSGITYPKWGKKWVNVRKTFSNFYNCKRLRLEEMLSHLGMTFEGTMHCGLHDSRNIARIAIRLMEDGCALTLNEYVEFTQKHKSINPSKPSEKVNQDDKVKVEKQACDKEVGAGLSHDGPYDTGIDQSLKSLTLDEKVESAAEENHEDLLEYYRLQKN